jgi:phage terminase large subunit GpA-like protein
LIEHLSNSPNSTEQAEFDAVDRAFLVNLRPPERLSVSDWADKYRILSGKASSEPGRWRTDRTPYLREIMDALSPESPVQECAWMAGAQLGKTECGNNWLGATIDQAPGAILVVWPTVEIAKKNSKLRLQPLIDATPVLRDKVRPSRERDSGNTILSKEFPGGILLITGANSSSGLRSIPAGKLFLDEVDVYPPDVDGEGDPLELAIVRSRNYHSRKIFICSTPTVAGRSRIEAKYEQGDQRKYEVPCPHCGVFQVLEWSRIKWEDGKPETVKYHCSGCGVGVEEAAHKTAMLAAGRWRATNPNAPQNLRSYHLSSLYSPIPWYSWEQAARDFVKAKESPNLLRVWVNTVLGETWKEKGEAPEWERLFNRREGYKPGVVPRGGLLLTAGADVQRDRIEVEVVAWGRNLESWSIAYLVFPGDTELESTWQPLTDLLSQTFEHESGSQLPIKMMAVDAGFNQNRVLSWVRDRPRDRVLGVKGRGRYPILIGQPTVVDVETRGRKVFSGAKLWPIGTGVAKSELYGWLRIEQPTDTVRGYPRGYCHFPKWPEEYFRQMCAEQLTRQVRRGYTVYEWEKMRDRNEALDCRVYARAASAVLGVDRLDAAQWARIERALGMEPVAAERHPEPVPESTTSAAQPKPRELPVAKPPPRKPNPGADYWRGR